jgi:hypothetical protein
MYSLNLARRVIDISSEQVAAYLSLSHHRSPSTFGELNWDEDVYDFASWYIITLLEISQKIHSLSAQNIMTSTEGETVAIGNLVKDKLLDAVVRWKVVQRPAVSASVRLLGDEIMLERITSSDSGSTAEHEVLTAAAWICGELCGCVFSLLLPSSY